MVPIGREVCFVIINKSNNNIYQGKISGYIMSSSTKDQINDFISKTDNIFEIDTISTFQEFELSA